MSPNLAKQPTLHLEMNLKILVSTLLAVIATVHAGDDDNCDDPFTEAVTVIDAYLKTTLPDGKKSFYSSPRTITYLAPASCFFDGLPTETVTEAFPTTTITSVYTDCDGLVGLAKRDWLGGSTLTTKTI